MTNGQRQNCLCLFKVTAALTRLTALAMTLKFAAAKVFASLICRARLALANGPLYLSRLVGASDVEMSSHSRFAINPVMLDVGTSASSR